jgi:hypothetical protein
VTDPTPTPTTTPAPLLVVPTTAPPDTKPQITPEIQKLIDDAAKGARLEGERLGKAAADAAIAAAKQKADDDAAQAKKIEEGKFEEVKTDLESKLTAATTERDAFKAKYEDALAQIKPGVEADWATLPAEVKAVYAGAEDDVIAKSAYLAKTKDLVAALAGTSPTGPRPPMTPRPNTNGQLTAEGIRDELRRQHGLPPRVAPRS